MAWADGAQLFVWTTDVTAVLTVIEAYVKEHGCGGRYDGEDDRIDTFPDRRTARTFAVAPPEDGWVTVWEDGVFADRRLAATLAAELDTTARWLMISASTGTAAAFIYAGGKEHEANLTAADDLPNAGVFLPDPTLGRYLAGLDVPTLQEYGITADDLDAALADIADHAPPGTERRTFPC